MLNMQICNCHKGYMLLMLVKISFISPTCTTRPFREMSTSKA